MLILKKRKRKRESFKPVGQLFQGDCRQNIMIRGMQLVQLRTIYRTRPHMHPIDTFIFATSMAEVLYLQEPLTSTMSGPSFDVLQIIGSFDLWPQHVVFTFVSTISTTLNEIIFRLRRNSIQCKQIPLLLMVQTKLTNKQWS